MQTAKFSVLFCACILLAGGCVSEQQYKDLKVQNDMQREKIAELQSELQTAKLSLDQMKRQLATAGGTTNVETSSLREKIAALEEDIAKKKSLIASMQQQLLYGGAALPVELSTMLEDFAKGKEMVTFDAGRGVVKFKSDLLFEKGSAKVAADAVEAVKSLCAILNSQEAMAFDIIIVGHTDDLPIRRPETSAEHPTNWHLSAHRAIGVLEVMAANNIAAERLSIRGFGEYRPVEPNQADKKAIPRTDASKSSSFPREYDRTIARLFLFYGA